MYVCILRIIRVIQRWTGGYPTAWGPSDHPGQNMLYFKNMCKTGAKVSDRINKNVHIMGALPRDPRFAGLCFPVRYQRLRPWAQLGLGPRSYYLPLLRNGGFAPGVNVTDP